MEIGSRKWKQIIIDGAKTLDVRIDEDKTDLFAVHAFELIKWNRKINLTAITDPLEIAVKHFVDSVAAASLIAPGSSVLDIGSGGGFPGIPLKIIMPSLSVTLIDATRKKVSFLGHMIRKLKLTGIHALHIRAEDLVEDSAFANTFDVILCRAFSSLDGFVSKALPLLAKEGSMIALKGNISTKEMETARLSALQHPHVDEKEKKHFAQTVTRFMLPYFNDERSIVCLKFESCK